MAVHTVQDLKQMQALPLNIKIRMTEQRIRDWVNEFGESGVYISFSGGKDSTVLLDIARKLYPGIKAMFVDVPTQYPELKEFAMKFDNVDIVKPKIGFPAVCKKYGFPLISKEVSECVWGARRYLTSILEDETILTDRQTDRQTDSISRIITGTREYVDRASTLSPTRGGTIQSIEESEDLANLLNQRMKERQGGQNQRLAIMLGMLTKDKENPIKANIPSKDRSTFSLERYKFFLEAPFEISNACCRVMKKEPARRYGKETGRMPVTAQMASESRLRLQKWLQNGCNSFDAKKPMSNPMAFWTEQDVLRYIKEYNLPICSVYGEVVVDQPEECEGQISIFDLGYMSGSDNRKLKTTGCDRTGCVCCGFGCHLEKSPNRFERLKETHPKLYQLLDVCENNGITYKEAIDWINEHGNLNIKY